MDILAINAKNRARFVGQAGVYRVAAELLLRGLNPRFPSVDCGADIEVDGGVRIQVKMAHLRYNAKTYPQGAYWFKFHRNPIVTGSANIRKRGPRVFSEECDFVVLHGAEQLRYWIVPASILDNCSLVVVGPEVAWVDANIQAIEELKRAGLTQDEIAAKLGLTQITISRRLRGFYITPKRFISQKVRECESQWGQITDMVRTLTESPATIHDDIVEESEKV
jgi:hypothetical protein